ncbi:DapH/DapD/GlmU-related protein [Falsirhodobacter deserti]|uniref:DapH/DapD/GlmU-related protein n=1 Tax=Falsirhodobacter deserti TaxID=1365611 RepID=UPI00240D5360|nr:DapH/DapD/GlmU-related protein [Falsirhodobacter deserti]
MTGGWMACHDGSAIMINQAEGTNFDAVAPIIIGDNVFIGYGSIILPGVTIGSNVVIGAGSVVSRDVPDRSIVAGAPARQIGTYDAYLDKLVARNEDLPWRHLIECRKGGYDPSLEPGLAKLRQAHFFG